MPTISRRGNSLAETDMNPTAKSPQISKKRKLYSNIFTSQYRLRTFCETDLHHFLVRIFYHFLICLPNVVATVRLMIELMAIYRHSCDSNFGPAPRTDALILCCACCVPEPHITTMIPRRERSPLWTFLEFFCHLLVTDWPFSAS